MADLKLVGAVAIKLRPDARGFKKDAEAKIKAELRGYEAEVDLKVNADVEEAKADVDKAKEEIERKIINLRVGVDYDSVRRAQAQLNAAVKNELAQDIKVNLKDPDDVKAKLEELKALEDDSEVNVMFTPDEKGYREVLARIEAVRRQRAEIPFDFKVNEEELAAKAAQVQGILDTLTPAKTITIEYDENRAGLEKAIADIDRELAKFHDVTIDVNADKETLLKAREEIADALSHMPPAKVPFKIEWDDNRASIEAALADVERELAKHKDFTVDINANKASLLFARDTIRAQLDNMAVHVDIAYNENQADLEKAIAEIDAELAKVSAVHIDLSLNPLDLLFTKMRLEEELGQQTVRIDYDDNLASLEAAKARIQELLGIGGNFHIDTKLDEASLREALAKIDAKIKEAEQNRLNIKPALSLKDYLTTAVAIKELTKNQTVNIFTKINDASLFLAAAKLTGLRAASRWTEEFAQTIGNLDRNLPIVALAVTGISQLASGIFSLTSDIFSLGNGVGEVVRMAGLLAPAMVLGLGASMIVLKGVFKDFGAAVNGDKTAMKALTESGKQAAAEIRPIFQSIRETISKNFWTEASDSMLRFVETALPAFGKGLGQLAGSMGNIFGTLLDSFTNFAKQGGLSVFFANMSHGWDLAQPGLTKFMDAFNTLAVVGSTAFPQMGRAFSDWADGFNAWIQKLSADGTLKRWIDEGIQGLKDLFNSAVSLIKIWGNIGQAAQAAGALTLHSFSDALAKLDALTGGARFQQNMKTIFEGAGQASDIFFQSLGKLGPVFDTFSVTFKNVLVNSAQALSAFIADVGDVLSSPRIGVGFTAFLTGVKQLFVDLRPSAADIATILQTVGQIMGKVASDSGPLFRNLFHDLAGILTTAWTALQPFLPNLILLGTAIINTLAPALSGVVQALIPAFATGVQKIGEGLLPLIKFVGDFAVGLAQMVAALPPGVVVGIATSFLTLGGAMQFANTMIPLVNGAIEVLGNTVALSEIQMTVAIPVVGVLLAALSGLAIGGIASLAASQHVALVDANEYRSALIEDGKAAGGLAEAIGLATTNTAINALAQAGAYDKAHKLGITTAELTNAVVKGGPALDLVNGKLAAINKVYDDNFAATQKANQGVTDYGGAIKGTLTPAMGENKNLANDLLGILHKETGNLDASKTALEAEAEARKAAGIPIDGQTTKLEKLATQIANTSAASAAAAQAQGVLTDAFSSSQSKVDAMRKTFELLLGGNAKEQAAETLGAYAKGFQDLQDTVKPVAQDMRNLGDAAFGEDGFLNVASGNKAVLQVNQALVDEVNNVWTGAKAAYDAAIKQGKTAQQAFADAQKFADDHHGDFNQLAEDSGVSADKVQGQWKAVFDHDWVLKVSMSGMTEAAQVAQELIGTLKGSFDGKDFVAYMDANPAAAMKAIKDPVGAAQDYVDHNWEAQLKMLPKPAQDAIRAQIGVTDDEWNNGDFSAILQVAQKIPGMAEALEQLYNGASNGGKNWEAIVFAITNKVSIAEAEKELNDLAARRTANIDVIINRGNMPDLNGDASGNGRFGSEAIGAILDGVGRGLRGFAPIYKSFANGGIERHVAQIARPGVMPRVWAEAETGGEAYVPLHPAKRVRSVAILKEVASMFGYQISKAQSFADGGTTVAPSSTSYHAPVHIGQLITTDPDAAVAALQQKRRDAMAVHNIRPF